MAYPTSIATKLDPSRTANSVNRGRPSWELLPDEPIGPDRRGGSGRKLRGLALLGLVLLGGAWAVMGEPSRWREWIPDGVVEQVSALINRSSGGGAPRPEASPEKDTTANRVATDGQASADQPSIELRAQATLAPAEPKAGENPIVLNTPATAAPSAPATAIGSAYATASPGPDPLGKRATSAGLHPDISRALLQRLSEADFKNAGVAIQKAITETPDDAVLVWPRQRKPDLALFQVYFVPGAAPDCRRYVVTITKDAWNTTALPMERCGVKPIPPPSRAK